MSISTQLTEFFRRATILEKDFNSSDVQKLDLEIRQLFNARKQEYNGRENILNAHLQNAMKKLRATLEPESLVRSRDVAPGPAGRDSPIEAVMKVSASVVGRESPPGGAPFEDDDASLPERIIRRGCGGGGEEVVEAEPPHCLYLPLQMEEEKKTSLAQANANFLAFFNNHTR